MAKPVAILSLKHQLESDQKRFIIPMATIDLFEIVQYIDDLEARNKALEKENTLLSLFMPMEARA